MNDKKVEALIKKERARSRRVVNLIASENMVSKDVLAALSSSFVNKYAEGYPHARYYKGNDVVDELEELTQQRAKKLFALDDHWHVNVQPHSGSPANLAVLHALVPQGGKIMGMSLQHGGHLTHGHKVSVTGKIWQQISYGVDEKTETIDYDALLQIAKKEKPALIIAGYTAYPRQVDWKRFRAIADSVGALLVADMSHVAGLVAGRVYPSPFPHADVVTTTTHKTLRGPRGAMIFSRVDERLLHEKIDRAVFPGLQGGPHMHTIAGIAVALHEANSAPFRRYAKQIIVNANALARELRTLGWRLIAGGTDSHLVLVDVWMEGKGVGGKRASEILEEAGIIVNMNSIPFDTRKPNDPSGIRLGVACETTKGKDARAMKLLANKIDRVLRKHIKAYGR